MAITTFSRDRLPLPYWLWFLWIDPVLSLTGVYGGLFAPQLLLLSYIPADNPNVVPNPAHAMIFNQLAGFFFLTFTLSTFMLRSTSDLVVWKYYHGAIAVVDVIICVATCLAFVDQGRLSPTMWRAEDWFGLLCTGMCAVLRVAFVLGVGLGGNSKRKTN